MSSTIYHFPELSRPDLGIFRGPGPGLGNLLFPVARALQAQRQTGGIMVFPTMRQIKIGTYFRREKDKRTYGEIFRPRTLAEVADWVRATTQRKRLETDSDLHAQVVRYVGMGRQFHDLSPEPDFLRQFLWDASRMPVPVHNYDVAIHVRLGDFAPPNASATQKNIQVPLEWYREALDAALELLGGGVQRGILFSDEAPEAVIGKLGLKGFIPEPRGTALTSILLMSQAKVLIGSRSTFSLWGQYLGQSHAFWPQGFDLAKYKRPDAEKDIFV